VRRVDLTDFRQARESAAWLLPAGAVLLAALGGAPVGSLRQIVLLALIIQLAALALGVIAWLISIGSASAWFTSEASATSSPPRPASS
jgi:hypothetical protein